MSTLILNINKSVPDNDKLFLIKYETSSKFKYDKINFENEDFYLLLDGIILNKKHFLRENLATDWPLYLIQLYKENGNQFFKHLKGSYYGFLFDKRENKWIVFSDHIGSKPLYIANYKDQTFLSNDYMALVCHLKQDGRDITLNEQGAYLLLTYGYVFEDLTITNEIKRLKVGYCLIIENNQFRDEKYYTLMNEPINITEEEAIEQIEIRFGETVQLAFEKDLDYGYKHVASLSGGLDSRMTVWMAHKLGYVEQLNLTFSQSNYLDETIAKQIAADLKHEWLFKALDNGNFLKNIDETTQITGGNVLYYGLAHGLSMFNYINFDNLGILHSGQLGDVVISTFYSSLNPSKQFNQGDGAYSKQLVSEVENINFKEHYPNEEIFKLYIRGFYGANQGLLGEMKLTETYSPFYDIDFINFALSIPLKLRYKHRLYKKWINEKHPEAARYVWEKEKVPVNYRYWLNIGERQVALKELPTRVLAKLGINRYDMDTKNSMNPLEYWYKTNCQLKLYMDSYYNENIQLLNAYPKLKADCKKIYFESKGTEKIQVLSLLSACKYMAK